MMRTLMGKQFRSLKWFLIGALVLIASFTLLMIDVYDDVPTTLWRDGPMVYSGSWLEPSLLSTLTRPLQMAQIFAVIAVILMAFWQQFEALQPRGMQLMASMPMKRKSMLSAQLIMGLMIMAVCVLTLGIMLHILFLQHRESYELAARISMYPEMYARLNTPLTIWAAMLRLSLVLTSAYLLITVMLGMFGNVFVGFGFTAVVSALGVVFIACMNPIMESLRVLFPALKDMVSFRTRSLFWSIPNPMVFFGRESDIPFVLFHMGVITACLLIVHWQRKSLENENLGRSFLYTQTRWLWVVVLTLFPVCFALADLTTYLPGLGYNRAVYNVLFPLWLVPIAVVFFVSWFFLVRRRKIAIQKNAVVVLALVLALFGPGMGNAWAEASVSAGWGANIASEKTINNADWVMVSFDGSRIGFDRAHAQRILNLIDQFAPLIGTVIQNNINSWDEFDEWNYVDSTTQDPNDSKWKGFGGTYDEVVSYYVTFCDWPLFEFPVGSEYLNETQVVEALNEAGQPELAEQFRNRDFEAGVISHGNFMMSYRKSDRGEGELDVCIYTDTPLFLKSAGALDQAILNTGNVLRSFVYSNGTYETAHYEWRISGFEDFMMEGKTMKQLIIEETPLNAVFREGELERLMLSLRSEYSNKGTPLTGMMDAAVAQGGISRADADRVQNEIASLLELGKSGSGKLGNATWTAERVGFFGFHEMRIELVFP